MDEAIINVTKNGNSMLNIGTKENIIKIRDISIVTLLNTTKDIPRDTTNAKK